jgi:uncharacterized protein (TIGR03437 family)
MIQRATVCRTVVILSVLGIGSALRAQVQTCNANVSVSPTVRSEGYAELTGDVVIVCTGVPTQGTFNVTATYSVGVTSRLLPLSTDASLSEVLLLIDDPQPGSQIVCSTPRNGCPAVVGAPTANVYQGFVSVNQVTFFGVPFLAGPTGSHTYRITNVRVNANSVGGSGTSGATAVLAAISFGGTQLPTVTTTVAFVQSSLSVSSGSAVSLSQCASQNQTPLALLTFAENFPTAFKTRVAAQTNTAYAGQANNAPQNVPGQVYNSESGFTLPIPNSNSQTAGLAEYGTRLKATFQNVPVGAHIFVSSLNVTSAGTPANVPNPPGGNAANTGTSPYAQLVSLGGTETASDSGSGSQGFVPGIAATGSAFGVPIAEVLISNGTGSAAWEVINTNPNSNEVIRFAVYASYNATNFLSPGTATVNLSYAPSPPAFTPQTAALASSTLTLPRFIAGLFPRDILTITACSLDISKSHSGNFTRGQTNATYSLVVFNPAASSTPSSTVTVTDTPPTGLSIVSMSGIGWTCPSTTATTQSCTRSDSLLPNGTYLPITVTVKVAPDAASPLSNTATVGGGWSGTTTALDSTIITSSLTVACTPNAGPTAVGVSYTSNCSATGGVPPFTWSITPGSLPSGLRLTSSGATASVSGAPSLAGNYSYSVTVSDGSVPSLTASQPFSGNISGTGTPVIQSVLNYADGRSLLCPGVLATISGSSLGPAQSQPGGTAGTQVFVSGARAAIVSASAQRVVVQLPVESLPGNAQVVVQYQNGVSVPFPISLIAAAPGILTTGSGSPGIASFTRANSSTGSLQNPATPGEVISLLVIGLGPSNPSVPTGVVPPNPAGVATFPVVTFAGQPAAVIQAALGSTSLGTYFIKMAVPGNVAAGTYPVVVNVGNTASLAATLPVGVSGITISQTGFTFQAVQNGGAPPSETFQILNQASQPLNYSLTTSVLSGGPWLSVSPAAGSLTPGQPTPISVSVNPTNVAAGAYYGQIAVAAPQASNSPQFLTIVLNVAPPTANPGPLVEPVGLVFVGPVNGTNPPAQSVRIANLISRPSSFTATGAPDPGNPEWFSVSPVAGSVSPNQPVSVSVLPNLSGLAPNIYTGTLTLQFPQDNTTAVVNLLLVVTPTTVKSSMLPRAPAAVAGCTPARLQPVLTALGQNFRTTVGWPSTIQATVVDDCQGPIDTGSVNASFNNGDLPLPLQPTGRPGEWSITWAAAHPVTSSLVVTVTAVAEGLQGTASTQGTAVDNLDAPIVFPNGVVSAGSYSRSATPSPGELVAVFGKQFADDVATAGTLPLPTILQGTKVLLQGLPIPLVFTSSGQINAQVPYNIPGTNVPILIQRGNTSYSVPQYVTLVTAQPAIFTKDLSGAGQGHIYVIPAPGQQVLADSANPAKAGDVLQIYCTGLGAVTPDAKAGDATPGDALRQTVNQVSLTIGGVRAPVAFAGLTPGFTGLYQINATVPAGASPDDHASVVISVAGTSSPSVPAVTMAIR